MKLPAHMRIQLSAFVRSDAAEAGGEIKVGGCVDTDTFTEIMVDGFTQAALDTLNATLEVTDARPMTTEEVREYLDEQQQDERDAGRISESERIDGHE